MQVAPLGTAGSFNRYGRHITAEEVHRRVMGALERRVLTATNQELRKYFQAVVDQTGSPLTGSGQDDAISSASDEDLEQTSLLLCHYDADGDGLLSRDEFAALVSLAGGHSGQEFSPEHVERCFAQADVDLSGAIDLNELLLYVRRGRGDGDPHTVAAAAAARARPGAGGAAAACGGAVSLPPGRASGSSYRR
jgi:hypothetical protein